MSADKRSDENAPDHSDAYYEELACQEEIYLEEREERARAVLISEGASSSACNSAGSPLPVEQLDHAAEELITGDSDDPPLSEEAVVEMLRMIHISKRSSL